MLAHWGELSFFLRVTALFIQLSKQTNSPHSGRYSRLRSLFGGPTQQWQFPGLGKADLGFREERRRQALAYFPSGGGHCLLSGLAFLQKTCAQQGSCLSLSPPGHPDRLYLCLSWCGARLTSSWMPPVGALAKKNGNVVVTSTLLPLSSRQGRFIL